MLDPILGMEPDLPIILKVLALTLVLPLALAWLASLAGVTGIALRSRLRKLFGRQRNGTPSSGQH